jgi:hypothetical protein
MVDTSTWAAEHRDRKNKLCKTAPFAACISTACKKSRVAQSWQKVKNKSCNATHSDTALTPMWTPNPSGMTSSAWQVHGLLGLPGYRTLNQPSLL